MALIENTEQSYYNESGDESLGNYQFVSLTTIINQFLIAYVGEDKLIPRVKRMDVAFHAQRALQEMSFDTFKSTKAIEIEIPPSLAMKLPQDYVNYTKIVSVDSSGIEHVLYPITKSSNPTKYEQDVNGDYVFDGTTFEANQITPSTTTTNFTQNIPAENANNEISYDDGVEFGAMGQRYGINPEHANINGGFYMDEKNGTVNFSSNLANQTVILKYISDSLGTESEMQVHKFAEEAMYKQIAFAILSSRSNVQEYIVNRFRKDARASKRTAKLRLSNIKLEEITQVLRGKSKQIKH